jgi:hypothetical protein
VVEGGCPTLTSGGWGTIPARHHSPKLVFHTKATYLKEQFLCRQAFSSLLPAFSKIAPDYETSMTAPKNFANRKKVKGLDN